MGDDKKIEAILDQLYQRAQSTLAQTTVQDCDIRARVEYLCCETISRIGPCLLMACLLARIDNPKVDPRKPYTEIGSKDSFSGRTYEEHLTPFMKKHHLPSKDQRAFSLRPLFKLNKPLTIDLELVGVPRKLYVNTLQLLEDVTQNRIAADVLFVEILRVLILYREKRLARLKLIFEAVEREQNLRPLAAETVVTLISQHLACKNSSRLPVLIVAAAYQAAEKHLGARAQPLNAHQAADLQTGALGDVEIRLFNDDELFIAYKIYKIKREKVTVSDIDMAVTKIKRSHNRIDSYIFVTTDTITEEVTEYAAKFYEETGGTEIAIVDCIGFLRHFLRLFHRLRTAFLDAYQELVLKEPDSAVSQTLKEMFLALRRVAEE